MGKRKNKELSQAEIWDDSALLQSWDDALAEYKLYHSIHAHGERVEDVIKNMEADDDNVKTNGHALPAETSTIEGNVPMPEDLEDGELEEELENVGSSRGNDSGGNTQAPATHETQQSHSHSTANAVDQHRQPPGMPNAIMNEVKDDALKNLMMSWYYAGYYTGLYDGQQAQSAASQ